MWINDYDDKSLFILPLGIGNCTFTLLHYVLAYLISAGFVEFILVWCLTCVFCCVMRH